MELSIPSSRRALKNHGTFYPQQSACFEKPWNFLSPAVGGRALKNHGTFFRYTFSVVKISN
jgi:hypothetical protein